jgi:SAM-dependent methyltransferase
MGKLLKLVTPLHMRTKRDYLARMVNDKVHCMIVAKKYGQEYWDGDRKYGYGGYHYDGRWKPVAEKIIRHYDLRANASILDVGCGKAHLLYELKKLLPASRIVGMDISRYGIVHAPKEIRPYLQVRDAQKRYPWKDKYFDLVISLGCLHNLLIHDLYQAIREIERVGKKKYIMVESYRNELEQFNLQCWALTAQTFLRNDEWVWLYKHLGYRGDYEFIYFE